MNSGLNEGKVLKTVGNLLHFFAFRIFFYFFCERVIVLYINSFYLIIKGIVTYNNWINLQRVGLLQQLLQKAWEKEKKRKVKRRREAPDLSQLAFGFSSVTWVIYVDKRDL